MITRLRKNLVRRLERQYGLAEIGYAWTREQERAKHQHYHLALFLDGDVIRHPDKLNKIIADTWQAVKHGNTAWHPRKCYHYVNDDDSKAQAVYRLSYLSKARGKGYRPDQAKDYGNSRLVMPRSAKEVGAIMRPTT